MATRGDNMIILVGNTNLTLESWEGRIECHRKKSKVYIPQRSARKQAVSYVT